MNDRYHCFPGLHVRLTCRPSKMSGIWLVGDLFVSDLEQQLLMLCGLAYKLCGGRFSRNIFRSSLTPCYDVLRGSNNSTVEPGAKARPKLDSISGNGWGRAVARKHGAGSDGACLMSWRLAAILTPLAAGSPPRPCNTTTPREVHTDTTPRGRIQLLACCALVAPMRAIEMSMEQRRNEGGKRKIPEQTADQRHRPAGFLCENSGVTRPGIEPGSPGWQARRLIAQPPRPFYADAELESMLTTSDYGTVELAANNATPFTMPYEAPWRPAYRRICGKTVPFIQAAALAVIRIFPQRLYANFPFQSGIRKKNGGGGKFPHQSEPTVELDSPRGRVEGWERIGMREGWNPSERRRKGVKWQNDGPDNDEYITRADEKKMAKIPLHDLFITGSIEKTICNDQTSDCHSPPSFKSHPSPLLLPIQRR
ncbi:hypothetical protein PR048_006170 [Dryococelus australis]|uniref:Uncharacterized protein n=1 Tax=Dryococelus australis TaxID=614101 RepID=A0ABQ9IA78_9NEOP|nr:hypothetical protein PR048_006170 [Dryococelus australis]